jgi:hypothetical protein
MIKIKNKKYRTIMIDAKLNGQIEYLSNNCGKSKVQIIREVVEQMFSVASQFKPNFGFWIMQDRNQIFLIFYGQPSIISGENALSDTEGEKKLDEEINQKLLNEK